MQQEGFVTQHFDTTNFVLFGLLRAHRSLPDKTATRLLHVYIEGDGFAWQSRTQPSTDPTPHTPVVLRLAQADTTAHAVLYLARPCQYVQGADARLCRAAYWTSARLAHEVLQSLTEAIQQAKDSTGASGIVLIGYSGGGGAAALVAAARTDVVFLGTIAGNLNHAAWTKLHRVSPLSDSRNPMEVAHLLRGLPQVHLSSTGDSVIPPALSQEFCQAVKSPHSCKVIEGLAHNGPWETKWNYQDVENATR